MYFLIFNYLFLYTVIIDIAKSTVLWTLWTSYYFSVFYMCQVYSINQSRSISYLVPIWRNSQNIYWILIGDLKDQQTNLVTWIFLFNFDLLMIVYEIWIMYGQGWEICMYETNLTLYLYCTVRNFILSIRCTNCTNCTKLY